MVDEINSVYLEIYNDLKNYIINNSKSLKLYITVLKEPFFNLYILSLLSSTNSFKI